MCSLSLCCCTNKIRRQWTKRRESKRYKSNVFVCVCDKKCRARNAIAESESTQERQKWEWNRRRWRLKRCWNVTVVDIVVLMVMGCIDFIYMFSPKNVAADRNFRILEPVVEMSFIQWAHIHIPSTSLSFFLSLSLFHHSPLWRSLHALCHILCAVQLNLESRRQTPDVDVNTSLSIVNGTQPESRKKTSWMLLAEKKIEIIAICVMKSLKWCLQLVFTFNVRAEFCVCARNCRKSEFVLSWEFSGP